jgi:hypothetical protein
MQYPDPRKPPVPGETRAVVPKKTARRLERFVMVPGVWKDRLLKAKHISTYRLALHVLVRHFETRGAPFILSNVAAELDGVTRRQKWRAIAELEALELIEVERRLRRSPRIRLLLVHQNAPTAVCTSRSARKTGFQFKTT